MTHINIPRPTRNEKGKIVGEFYPLQKSELLALRKSRYISSTAYVHLALRYENPWCDGEIEIDADRFCKEWDVSRSRFYGAIARLESDNVLITSKGKFFLLWSNPNFETDSQPWENNPKVGTVIPELGQDSQPWENNPNSGITQSPEALTNKAFKNKEIQTIQTNPDLIQTLSDGDGKKQTNDVIESLATTLLNQKESVPTDKPTRIDPFFTRRRSPQEIEWDWVPDGEWKLDGKLDANFVDWHARRWMQKYGALDIHEARKNVRAYYRNDPRRLADDWQEYHEATLHKATNIAIRQSNGINVPEQEKMSIVKHQAALRPSGKSVVRSQYEEVKQYVPSVDPEKLFINSETDIPMIAAEKEVDWDVLGQQTEEWEKEQIDIPVDESGFVENGEAYKNNVKAEDRDFWANLHNSRSSNVNPAPATPISITQLTTAKSMPTWDRQKEKEQKRAQTRVEYWNNLLATGMPSVMAEAERQALAAGYLIIDNQAVKPECE
ncbi:hypothetical protein [Aulosira sp. FACHB-615]|uniref:hypothetical protein n=1 Tax=Aulosira sp. FACHB-615 TaxID=2692777 RepID=UPI001685D3F5|nr:hypothetical protein [Aulosira sp. FACHB-615]MBD2488989.1 hypothetical protein [Aulosira sp. FACHB-615]